MTDEAKTHLQNLAAAKNAQIAAYIAERERVRAAHGDEAAAKVNPKLIPHSPPKT